MHRARQQLVGFISIICIHGVTPTRSSGRCARLQREGRALAGSDLDRLVFLVQHILVRDASCWQQFQTLRELVMGESSRQTITTRKKRCLAYLGVVLVVCVPIEPLGTPGKSLAAVFAFSRVAFPVTNRWHAIELKCTRLVQSPGHRGSR